MNRERDRIGAAHCWGRHPPVRCFAHPEKTMGGRHQFYSTMTSQLVGDWAGYLKQLQLKKKKKKCVLSTIITTLYPPPSTHIHIKQMLPAQVLWSLFGI